MKTHWSDILFKGMIIVLMTIIGFLIKFGVDKLDRTMEGMELRIRALEVGVAPATGDRFTSKDAEKLEKDIKEWASDNFVKK